MQLNVKTTNININGKMSECQYVNIIVFGKVNTYIHQ